MNDAIADEVKEEEEAGGSVSSLQSNSERNDTAVQFHKRLRTLLGGIYCALTILCLLACNQRPEVNVILDKPFGSTGDKEREAEKLVLDFAANLKLPESAKYAHASKNIRKEKYIVLVDDDDDLENGYLAQVRASVDEENRLSLQKMKTR